MYTIATTAGPLSTVLLRIRPAGFIWGSAFSCAGFIRGRSLIEEMWYVKLIEFYLWMHFIESFKSIDLT